MIPPNEFWNRLQQSNLLPENKVTALRAKIDDNPKVARSAELIARVLVNNEILTQAQAKGILADGTLHSDGLPQIQATDDVPATSSAGKKLPWVIGLTSVSLIGLLVGILFRPSSQQEIPSEPQQVLTSSGSDDPTTESPYHFVEDEDALWARPQPGRPFPLDHIPPGTQVIVRVRLADLVSHPDGPNILRSLGPQLEQQLEAWTNKIGVRTDELQELRLLLLPQGTTLPQVIVHGQLAVNAKERLSTNGDYNEHQVIKMATHAIWCPTDAPQHFYFGPWNVVKDLHATEAGMLRRELKHLHEESHDTDLISILANPNFLRDEAQGLFPNSRRRLLDGLFAFWSDKAQAVSLGYQHEQTAFLEVRMIARDDLPPRQLAAQVNAFLAKLPASVSDFLGRAQLDPHWQRLAMRFPQMLSFVVGQTRVVPERKQVAITAVAPPEATHNLLLASELGLATELQEKVSSTSPANAKDAVTTLQDALAAKTSVRFAQKSLEEALQDVVQQVRAEHQRLGVSFEIRIVGTDLEPEGITRNQQIRDFDTEDLPLSDVLTELMLKANPDQSVASAHETAQKLVWVPSPDQTGLILITTRTAAIERNLPLPNDFRPTE